MEEKRHIKGQEKPTLLKARLGWKKKWCETCLGGDSTKSGQGGGMMGVEAGGRW